MGETTLAAMSDGDGGGTRDLRPLVPSDIEAIKAINALTYDGIDYIAAAFPGWMAQQGDGLWTLAAEDDDGMVTGMEVLSLMDEGRTGWLDALRVHPRSLGQGLALRIQRELTAFALDHLKLERVRYCTPATNTASRKLATACGLHAATSWT